MHGPMVMDIELVTEEPPALEPPVSWAEFQDALSIAEDGYLRLPEYQWVAALAGAERTIAAFRSWAALNL
jgi:hypothetical protein